MCLPAPPFPTAGSGGIVYVHRRAKWAELMKMAYPSSVVSPTTVRTISSLFLPPTLGVENRTRAKMASRAANSVVRRLAHRNIDWCVSWVVGFWQKRCGDRSEGWSNRRLGSATSNGKSVGSARGFVLSCTEKKPPPMEMASPARGKGSGWAKRGGIGDSFGSTRETAALWTH